MTGESTKRWAVTTAMMISVVLYTWLILKFNIEVTVGVTLIEGVLLFRFGERLAQIDEKKHLLYPHLCFDMTTIIIGLTAFYLIVQACYTMEEGYYEWLIHAHKSGSKNIDFEIGTLILIYYFIFIWVYRCTIWKHMKEEVNKWIPSSWSILLGCCLMLFSREGVSHAVRMNTLWIGAVLLICDLVYRSFISKEQKVKFYIKPKVYLAVHMISLLAVWVIGSCLPEYQELPGARWIRNTVNSLGQHSYLHQKIPYEISLNNDISLSNAILFEVKASEPLYLREIAYTEYRDGKWYIPEGKKYESYIDLKFKYLEAEYGQTADLLDEISFQNSKDASILSQYAKMANYESTIVRKKSYMILQNPIDKINYFTVNGFFNIEDNSSNTIYYYQSLNNCYFHSENIVEPSGYRVDYYDHVPKVGSREYAFLKSIDHTTWEKIYDTVINNRIKYHLYDEEMPALLYSYSPMIQYQNAKGKFLQVPEELQESLMNFTKQITSEQVSDWDKAQGICDFLKKHFKYHLQNKKIEGERVSHFLFEQKEGICQDFATSMTLMCRSIGIPAKYVTGYLAKEKNNHSGNYVVREKDAHAFVEVYIAGYGWMSFDPTPAAETEDEKVEKSSGLTEKDYISGIMLGILLIGVLMVSRSGSTYLGEKWWLLIFHIKKVDKKLEWLIKREMMLLDRRGFSKYHYETLSQYQKRLESSHIIINKMISLYEKQRYGNVNPTKQEVKEVYEEYRQMKIALKSLK